MTSSNEARELLVLASQSRNKLYALKDVFRERLALGKDRVYYGERITEAQSAILLASDNMARLMAMITA